MAKKELIDIDYSNLTLQEIIRRVTKRKCLFEELETEQKVRVLAYIKKHNIEIHIFGKRWFDIIKNKFYVLEYALTEEICLKIDKTRHEFISFSEFYNFLKGDIYNNSCYFGYSFQKEEITEFSLDLGKINFSSFIRDTIETYTFEYLEKIEYEQDKAEIQKAKRMKKWLLNCDAINSCEELKLKRNQFVHRFNFLDAEMIFFSYILRTQKDSIKNFYIKYVCENNDTFGSNFCNVLFNYGRDAAINVIENYNCECSYSVKRNRIKKYKNLIDGYDSGTNKLQRRIYYSDYIQMYVVDDVYFNNANVCLRISNYFHSFDELSTFVGGNFRGADFTKAPIDKSELKAFIVDETTIYPLDIKHKKYLLKKFFSNDNFYVKQIWLDSNEREIKTQTYRFKLFFDFAYFLKYDLSGSDFLMCEGIENIKKIDQLKIDGIKVRSNVANLLNLKINEIPKEKIAIKEFSLSASNELETIHNLEMQRINENSYLDCISYISDIHLLHKINAYNCKSYDDVEYVIRLLANNLSSQSSKINLIAGDTCSDFNMFKMFMNILADKTGKNFFFTLGNHELWDSSFSNKSLNEIIDEYKKFTNQNKRNRLHLVHNNLFYLSDMIWKELSTSELISISSEELRAKMREAELIIFGGIGFAGKNEKFNANIGLYLEVLNREEEISESDIFYKLYEKVTNALKGMNLIVLTHMPIKDWGGDISTKEGVIYINGHNHRNYFYDNGIIRIYADNQIGYTGKKINFKSLTIELGYNWFGDFKDGIYEIRRDDYIKFYRGVKERISFNREYLNLYMLKKNGTYMFLMRTTNGSLRILNGGSIKNAGNHELEYFYNNLSTYAKSVSLFLSKYYSFEQSISSAIKRIGGDGYIHGCIVDIDYYNHIYINPIDGTLTPYLAYSIVDKFVYKNIPSLLKYECPLLYKNYEKLLTQESESNLIPIFNRNLPVLKNKILVTSTEIYKISRIIKGLQFTIKYNVVRLWNDSLATDASEDNGKLIVSEMINYCKDNQQIEQKEN